MLDGSIVLLEQGGVGLVRPHQAAKRPGLLWIPVGVVHGTVVIARKDARTKCIYGAENGWRLAIFARVRPDGFTLWTAVHVRRQIVEDVLQSSAPGNVPIAGDTMAR
jgi:hypothetical protein